MQWFIRKCASNSNGKYIYLSGEANLDILKTGDDIVLEGVVPGQIPSQRFLCYKDKGFTMIDYER